MLKTFFFFYLTLSFILAFIPYLLLKPSLMKFMSTAGSSFFCYKASVKEASFQSPITAVSEWTMFVCFFCWCFSSLYSNCSEIWGLSSPNTIEQWDTSGLYSYPDQTRWLSSLSCCIQLSELFGYCFLFNCFSTCLCSVHYCWWGLCGNILFPL